jgi:antitoxin MazE
MQVSKWGNSLAVRLPAQVVKVLGLAEGDDIEIEVLGARRLAVKKRADGVDDVMKRLRAFRGRLPADFKFDRLAANERG